MFTHRPTAPRLSLGFTLLEVIFVIVIFGVLTRYATVKWTNPAVLTLSTQAQGVAELARRAQSEALVRGQRMGVSVTTAGANGTITLLSCPGGTCSAQATYTAQQSATLSGSAVYFNSQGVPVNDTGAVLTGASAFTLAATDGATTVTRVVSVAALSGGVTVTP